ncbi:hypothetical protein [Streptomyces sp. NPDC012466]|uniref:hypothetical protein n=1 Tax=Streptomyces sp. NPDC012466 TaxID=3364835 RepID=UPI0036EE1326
MLCTYTGVFPATRADAELLTDRSAELAARAGVERLMVKTPAEAHRIPTVSENVRSLRRASDAAVPGRAPPTICPGRTRRTTARCSPRRPR